jgi:serine/threonine-protein kinase
MGIVYHAVHQSIGQRAAVKVLSPRLARDRASLKRFLNEARAVSLVGHPGLVKIFDFGETPRGTPYILMELLDGESLRARLGRLEASGASLARLDAARIARQIASALVATHERGIVHRDLKPDNVMLVADEEAPGGERVKLLDFGIAKFLAEASPATAETAPGSVIGTAVYMSPEQCAGSDELDGASDVYSLGVVLYELLAGRPPFRGDGPTVMRQHLFAEPPPLGELAPSLPVDLGRLVHRMLAKEPSLRPAIDRVADALRPTDRPGDRSADLAAAPSLGATEDTIAAIPRAAIASVTTAPPSSLTAPSPPAPLPAPRRRRGAALLAVIALAVGVVVTSFAIRHGVTRPPAKLSGMIWIDGATFTMGSPAEVIEAECQRLGAGCKRDLIEREQPAHAVTVSPFYLDEHEVTNEELAVWLQVVTPTLEVSEDPEYHIERWVHERELKLLLVDLYPDESGVLHRNGTFTARPGYERKPAIQVTWDAARLYCKARGKRLPTEAEWELAARGATSRRFPWGNEPPSCDDVVHDRGPEGRCAGKPTGPENVGTAPRDRTPEGVLDLGGNVGEWVYDQFLLPYYPPCGGCVDPRNEAVVPLADDYRIFRGGSWQVPEIASRTTTRSRWKRTDVMTGVGFRCASQ